MDLYEAIATLRDLANNYVESQEYMSEEIITEYDEAFDRVNEFLEALRKD